MSYLVLLLYELAGLLLYELAGFAALLTTFVA